MRNEKFYMISPNTEKTGNFVTVQQKLKIKGQ